MRSVGLVAVAGVLIGCAAPATLPVQVVAIKVNTVAATPLERGDAMRGKAVIIGRDGNCLLCHAIPETGTRFAGNLGPPLSGVGARMSEAELRLRLADSQKLNPHSIMPAYSRTEGLAQVGQTWRGKPILSPQQFEDAVAYLVTLR